MFKETPLIRLTTLNELTVYAKLENTEPSGSIKYRTALRIIENAQRSGQLRDGMEIIEHTSGNTGIALAKIGKETGYPVTIIAGRGATREAKEIIRSYGAKLVEVNGWFVESEKKVKELVRKNGKMYWLNQVANPSSLESNVELGVKIAEQFQKRFSGDIDIYAASMGTGSTITGVSRGLRKSHPKLRTYLVLPDGEYKYPGVDDKEEATVPLPLYDEDIVSGRARVREEDAVRAAKMLRRKYNDGVGVSTGAVFAALERLSETESGNAVMIFVDKSDRYAVLK